MTAAEITLERWEAENTCYSCDEPCSLHGEYTDDGRTFCSLDCLNEATE